MKTTEIDLAEKILSEKATSFNAYIIIDGKTYIDKELVLQAMEAYAEEKMRDMYPKEFVMWLFNRYTFMKSGQDFVINYPYISEHNDYRHFTLDELFNYWKENER